MRALVVISAMLIGACSFGALDGFSGTDSPDGGLIDGSTGESSTNPPGGDASTDSPPAFDAPTTSAYHAAVAADGPVAHFALEEATGPSCASSTTTSAICVYPQSQATRGASGIGGTKALHFDAKTATLSISGLSGNFALPYSIELWARIDSAVTGAAIGYMMDPGVGHPGPGFNLFVWDNDRLRTELWNSDTDIAYGVTPTALTADAWHHIVLAHSTGPDEDLFYVDAQLVEHDTNVAATRPTSVASPFTLVGFVGSIDEIAVYDKPLSPARIAAHYAAQ
jgi:hypothetical protein